MKFHLYSDLHNEFSLMRLPGDKEGILLLAGDILVADFLRKDRIDKRAKKYQDLFHRFFNEECQEKYSQTLWIAGNHEHYAYGIYQDTHDLCKRMAEDHGIIYLNNEGVVLDPSGLALFGGTMWTDFNGGDIWALRAAHYGMNDFAGQIYCKRKIGTTYFEPLDSVEEHNKFISELLKFIDEHKEDSIIVMSHHAPSTKSKHQRYGDDPLNWAFSSNLEGLITSNPQIRVWCHGHTHDSFDYKVGDCGILCNPRGYSYKEGEWGENPKFEINHEFEI